MLARLSKHFDPNSKRLKFSLLPFFFKRKEVVGPSGLEPPTSRLSVVRSSQLSYGPVVVDAKSAPFVTSSRPSLTALPCVSSPEQTRFAGLCSGTRECTL